MPSLARPGALASIFLLLAAWAAGPVLAVDYGSPAPATSTAPASLQLGAGSSASLGSFLVGPTGMTLYTLSSETGTGSVCTGGCLAAWPPLLVAPGGSVAGPSGATGTFSTITRADTGSTQVAYNGRPLYYFAHDTAAGQANGQGIKAFGGVWLVAALSGAQSSIQLGSATNATLGAFLTGSGGMTLYTLSSDPNNGSVCSGGCLANWPPLLIAPGGSTSGPAGATGTFGAFVRSDGTAQVTHDSRPLYYFAHDTAAGQTNGEGIAAFGGVWHVASAVLVAATSSPSATAAPTSAATIPPTSTGGGSGDGPGATPFFVLALFGAAAATIVTVGALSRRLRRA
jgi:predicted lipoprotein with Yx(FWY)xxD motif